MEIKCSDHIHIKTLQPPITLINLQPACSAFSTSWIYYIGGGSGSGSILLIVIFCLVCWRCKHHQSNETTSPSPVAYTAPENPNVVHTREGAIGAGQSSALGQRTAAFLDPVGNRRLVMDPETQYAFASALLDQFKDLGTNVMECETEA